VESLIEKLLLNIPSMLQQYTIHKYI